MSSEKPLHTHLSRRESQIMDIVYALGEAAAADIEQRLPDPPRNATVRAILRTLEHKGFLAHRKLGRKFVYRATVSAESARRSSFRHMVDVFFGGSAPKTVAAMLNMSRRDLSTEDLDELAAIIDRARGERTTET